ncbi:coiled-coil domain-containing protein 42 like-2-like [Cephus cinctus]|uniref:Coiled-coil domain-containing protein 42 like-2-like n=1 Tax=Cephus cinctus TaxID=211228 RepID=A0AAJ7BRL0_CEPCN|nr:coiled-coil domain-containing protein 42 like-2-like [Cephus cinctus]
MVPLIKPQKSLIQRAQITSNPQEAISEYFQSKLEDHQIKKYPEWDIARVSPAAELIKARQELALAGTELSAKRKEQLEKRKVMDEQWNDLRQKEELLRQSFIKFNKFAKENQEKRERAEHKINDELERQAARNAEAEELQEKMNRLQEIKYNMQKHVKEYKMYQNYLEKVVNETGQFQSISDVFNRYETLAEARASLSETQDKNLEALEVTGTEMYHMTEEKSQILMGLNNQLAQLQGRYDRAKLRALRWETMVSRIKATAAAKNLELTQVKSCCWNIYKQICRRKDIPIEVQKDDIENQLVHIKRTILELKRITRVAKKKAAKRRGS